MAADVLATPLEGVKLGRLARHPRRAERRARRADRRRHRARASWCSTPAAAAARGGDDEPHHLFVGVRDFRSPLVVERGRHSPRRAAVGTCAHVRRRLAEARDAQAVRRSASRRRPRAGARGARYAGKPSGTISWSCRSSPTWSPRCCRSCAMVPAERPAQVWIDVADLTGKQLAGAVNALGYMRSARNLGRRVPADEHAGQPAARAATESVVRVAERLMDGTFVVPARRRVRARRRARRAAGVDLDGHRAGQPLPAHGAAGRLPACRCSRGSKACAATCGWRTPNSPPMSRSTWRSRPCHERACQASRELDQVEQAGAATRYTTRPLPPYSYVPGLRRIR